MLGADPAGRQRDEGREEWLPPSATATCRCCLTSRLNVPTAGAWQGLFKHVAQAAWCAKAPWRRMFAGFGLIPPLIFANLLPFLQLPSELKLLLLKGNLTERPPPRSNRIFGGLKRPISYSSFSPIHCDISSIVRSHEVIGKCPDF